MNCPKCADLLVAGQLVAEQSSGEWAAVGLWLLSGMVPMGSSSSWYFEPFEGDKQRVPLVGRRDLTAAHRCPKCETIVITTSDPTREEMVARWKALTDESPHH